MIETPTCPCCGRDNKKRRKLERENADLSTRLNALDPVPVSERLPEPSPDRLIFFKDHYGQWHAGHYDPSPNHPDDQWFSRMTSVGDVVEWMPVPSDE